MANGYPISCEMQIKKIDVNTLWKIFMFIHVFPDSMLWKRIYSLTVRCLYTAYLLTWRICRVTRFFISTEQYHCKKNCIRFQVVHIINHPWTIITCIPPKNGRQIGPQCEQGWNWRNGLKIYKFDHLLQNTRENYLQIANIYSSKYQRNVFIYAIGISYQSEQEIHQTYPKESGDISNTIAEGIVLLQLNRLPWPFASRIYGAYLLCIASVAVAMLQYCFSFTNCVIIRVTVAIDSLYITSALVLHGYHYDRIMEWPLTATR